MIIMEKGLVASLRQPNFLDMRVVQKSLVTVALRRSGSAAPV